jgi:hypothetical protein
VSILKQFRLAFQLSDSSLLLPCHLSEKVSDVAELAKQPSFPVSSGVRIRRDYTLSFAPEHLFFHIVFRCHPYILGDAAPLVFKNAVVLQNAGGNVAVLLFSEAAKTLTMHVRGPRLLAFMFTLVEIVQVALAEGVYSKISKTEVTASCPCCLGAEDGSDGETTWSDSVDVMKRSKAEKKRHKAGAVVKCGSDRNCRVPADELLAYFDGQRAMVAVASDDVAVVVVTPPADSPSKPVTAVAEPEMQAVTPAPSAPEPMVVMTRSDFVMLLAERDAKQAEHEAARDRERDVKQAEHDAERDAKQAERDARLKTDIKAAITTDGKKTRRTVVKSQEQLSRELAEIENEIITKMLKMRHAAVPSLAVLAPRERTKLQKWSPKNWTSNSFALHLVCEMPGHRHFLPAVPYEVTFPKAFIASCAPFLVNLLKFAQVLLKLPLPFMPDFEISDEIVAGIAGLAKGGADGLPGLADDMKRAQEARKAGGEPVTMNPGDDAVAQRQLQAWIKELAAKVGKGHEYQGLIDVVHPSSGAVLWVCAEHKVELEDARAARKQTSSVKKDATKKVKVLSVKLAAVSSKADTSAKSPKKKVKNNKVAPAPQS